MIVENILYYSNAWTRNIIHVRSIPIFMWPIGFGITISKFGDSYFSGTSVPEFLRTFLNNYWIYFIISGAIMTVISRHPHLNVSERLSGRDVRIRVAIGDLFSRKGAIIVPTNTTFDTQISTSLISKRSVQGQFTAKYYFEYQDLDKEINSKLTGLNFTALNGERTGKSKRYDIVTTIRVKTKDRTGYFCATAELNENGAAYGDLDLLKQALASLWIYMGNFGSKEKLLIPVIGTGFMRLTEERQKIIRVIIQSFVAACTEKNFCDDLTIVVSSSDATKYGLNLNEIGDFLKYICRYTEFSSNNNSHIGTPVVDAPRSQI